MFAGVIAFGSPEVCGTTVLSASANVVEATAVSSTVGNQLLTEEVGFPVGVGAEAAGVSIPVEGTEATGVAVVTEGTGLGRIGDVTTD